MEGRYPLIRVTRGRSLTGLQDKVPLSEKLDQIMAWIDLPLEQRPQFISGSSLFTAHF